MYSQWIFIEKTKYIRKILAIKIYDCYILFGLQKKKIIDIFIHKCYNKINFNKKFYNFANITEQSADLYIYGEITSYGWDESDVSAYSFKEELEDLKTVSVINVHINSYGGETVQGLAIYNLLKQHSATINVYVDGAACSSASIIAMAGDKIYMPKTSLMAFFKNKHTV